MIQNRDKCKFPRCRAEPEILFADGTGYCDEHFDDYCEGKLQT